MSRAGTGLKNDDLDHRMEYFDPKTRPAALFWDSDALLTAPVELLRSTGTTTFTAALRSVAQPSLNPLVEGDRLQAFRHAQHAQPAALARPDDPAPRIDLCASAFLINRAADDDVGRRTDRDDLNRGAYALATALHLRYHGVGQGEATSALLPAAIRQLDPAQGGVVQRLAELLGAGRAGMSFEESLEATAAEVARFYRSIGMPASLSELSIPREDLTDLAQSSVKNFNANPGERASSDYDALLALLEAAW
jgi:alcohol dehydrogenase class IV